LMTTDKTAIATTARETITAAASGNQSTRAGISFTTMEETAAGRTAAGKHKSNSQWKLVCIYPFEDKKKQSNSSYYQQ